MAWSLRAVLLGTPLLVLLTAWFGPSLTHPLVGELGYAFRLFITVAAFVSIRWLAVNLSRRSALSI